MEILKLRLKSVTPMILHSDRGLNALDPEVKALKKVTAKRKKTDEDIEAIARLEWHLALYWDDVLGVHVPSQNLEAFLRAGAKQSRLGAAVQRAVQILDDAKLEFPWPHKGKITPDNLYKNKEFVDYRPVRVGNAKIMRCRPVFTEWSLDTELIFNPTVIDRDQVIKAATDAGSLLGLNDYRPKYGRCNIEVIS